MVLLNGKMGGKNMQEDNVNMKKKQPTQYLKAKK